MAGPQGPRRAPTEAIGCAQDDAVAHSIADRPLSAGIHSWLVPSPACRGTQKPAAPSCANQATSGFALPRTSSEPASSTPSWPLSGTKQAVPVFLGPAGRGLLQAISSLGRQLVDGHRGPVQLTGFYAVLQATTGVKKDRPRSITIDCYGDKRTVGEKDVIMEEWRQPRVANRGASSMPSPPAAVQTPHRPPGDRIDAVAAAKGGNEEIGSDGVDDVVYPEVVINSSHLLLSFSSVKKGVERLSLKDFNAVVSACRLRT